MAATTPRKPAKKATAQIVAAAPVDIDFDAERKKAPTKPPKSFRLDGVVYECRPELPVSFAFALESDDLGRAFELMLVDPSQAETLKASTLTTDEFFDLTRRVYGESAGESQPSVG